MANPWARRLHDGDSTTMDVRNRYTETLSCAAATIGGAERLAQFLNVPKQRLFSWLAGEESPPNQVFLDALDVIAAGPYAAERRVKVAAVDTDKLRR